MLGSLLFALAVVRAPGTAPADGSAPSVRPAEESMLLWPDGAPGALGTEAKDQPRLLVHRPAPERATGVAVVVCPGGGYGALAMDHEGAQIAEWLNGEGILAAIVDYRHRNKGYGHPAPLEDAQRALRLVRSHAADWSVDANRIGVLGFSAGGHLAATVTTLFDQAPVPGAPHARDAVDALSARPDFSVLIYPVILFEGPFAHAGSRKNLLGDSPDPETLTLLSPVHQLSANTPPVFFVHTMDDRVVPPENSYALAQALGAAGVSNEVHVFRHGDHGFGLGRGMPAGAWPTLCLDWLRDLGTLPPKR